MPQCENSAFCFSLASDMRFTPWRFECQLCVTSTQATLLQRLRCENSAFCFSFLASDMRFTPWRFECQLCVTGTQATLLQRVGLRTVPFAFLYAFCELPNSRILPITVVLIASRAGAKYLRGS